MNAWGSLFLFLVTSAAAGDQAGGGAPMQRDRTLAPAATPVAARWPGNGGLVLQRTASLGGAGKEAPVLAFESVKIVRETRRPDDEGAAKPVPGSGFAESSGAPLKEYLSLIAGLLGIGLMAARRNRA